jgi:hypothetical protein
MRCFTGSIIMMYLNKGVHYSEGVEGENPGACVAVSERRLAWGEVSHKHERDQMSDPMKYLK